MKKLKLLLAFCALLLGWSNAMADTDKTSSVSTEWKKSDGTTTAGTAASSAAPYVTPSGGSSVAMYEAYDATNTAATGTLLQQTVTGLTNGTYRVEFYANAMHANNVTQSATSYTNSRVYVFANTQYKQVTPEEKNSTTQNGEYTINNVVVSDGTLKLGLYKHSAGTNWHTIQIKSLTLLSDALATNATSLMNASEASPIDATDFLPVSVITNSSATGWTFTGSGRGYNNGVWEVYNQNFKLEQTLSNMPNGRYVVKVQGFYRAGGGGTTSTAQNVKLFANGVNSNALNILSESYDSKPGTGKWSEVNTKFVPNDLAAGGYAFYMSEKYKSNSVTSYVTNNTLNLGLEKTVAVSSDWSLFNGFEIKCTGIYLSAVAQNFTSGSTMEAGQWYKYTIPTDGDYTFSATDGIVYSTTDAFVSDTHSNVSSTTALPAGTVYIKSTTSQSLTISYVEPVVENGTYYLYDATNKVFLSRGENYGTRASVDKYGIPIKWNNYSKCITFADWNGEGGDMFFDKSDHTGCWLYTDGGSAKGNDRLFAFEATEGGYYLRDLAKAVYIKHDNTALDVPTTDPSYATIWTLKNREEHDAIVAAYINDNKNAVITAAGISTTAAEFESYLSANLAAKDKTALVGTAKFSGSAGDWTWTDVRSDGNVNYGTDYAEAWRKSGHWAHSTITDLPEGIYKLTVNAFERANGYVLCNTLGDAGWEPVTAYFEANGQKVVLKSWYSEKTGTSNPNNTGEAATAFNNNKYKNEVYCYVGDDGKLDIKLAKPSFTWDSWVLFNNVTLTYYDSNVSDEEATAILSEASTAMDSPMKHSLYASLSTAKETFDGARTVPNYNALRTAIDNTATSVTSYANMYTNYLEPLNTYFATTNFVQSDAYNTYLGYKSSYDNYKTTGADVENATANALSITSGSGTNYTSTYSLMMLPNWTKNGTAALSSSGFYVNTWSTESAGTSPAKDFANPFYEYWVSSGSLAAATIVGTMTGLNENTIYKVTANVRIQGTNEKVAKSITMQVGDGAETDVTAGSKIGETNRYIDSYSAVGMTDGDGKLTLTFNVAASSNISWLTFRDVNYEEATNVDEVKTYLNTRISAASSARKTANEGTGVFQIPTAAGTTLASAITTAQSVYDNAGATLSDVITAISTLNAAVATYEATTLNAPDADKHYNIIVATTGHAKFNNAVVESLGATSANNPTGYSFKASATPNVNLAQAVKFTQVSGNTYNISFETSEGVVYLTYGSLNGSAAGWADSQIQGTTVAANKGVYKIAATATANVFNIYNTITNSTIACQTGGSLYTEAGNADFSIAETSQAEVAINIASDVKYATRIFPFAPELPSGVKAYSCDAATGSELTLVEVAEPQANVPYILEATSGYSGVALTGWGTAATTSYTVGWLTGVYENTNAEDGWYVLQNNNDKVAFYLVDTSSATPTVGANRCYLSVPVVEGARAAYFFRGSITSVDNVEATATVKKNGAYLENGKIAIYKNGMKFSATGAKLK